MSFLKNEENRVGTSWFVFANDLYRHFNVSTHDQCLLWIDPAQHDPFEGNDIVEQLRIRVPIRHPRFDPTRAPYLVPLDLSRSADSEIFNQSVELAWLSWSIEHLNAMQGQPVCGWVSTSADAKAVAGHWGAHCHVHFVQHQTKLLRFQDPGVREWLWPAISATQRRALLGLADDVIAIGRTQQPIHHVSNTPSTASSDSRERTQPGLPKLQLEQNQWSELDDYATLHAAWLTLQNLEAGTDVSILSAGWERSILRALAHAGELGVQDEKDRELFALHALQLGSVFYKNPRLADVWKQTKSGEFYGSSVETVIGCPAAQLHTKMQMFPDSRIESKHDY